MSNSGVADAAAAAGATGAAGAAAASSAAAAAGATAASDATAAAGVAAAPFAFPDELSAFFDISSLQQIKNHPPSEGITLPLSTITSTTKLCAWYGLRGAAQRSPLLKYSSFA